ncbi:MAG: choice-of-anchor I family protein [Anaerolineales bacterium]|nr:choice-of-anchor I family protein [Anaerolineales bacterium]MCB9127345.1 choice-of-anchor I family protein [Ardenticatenales bacterium]
MKPLSAAVAAMILALTLAWWASPTPSVQASGGSCDTISYQYRGSYLSPAADTGAAEIVKYDPATERLFVVNAVENKIDAIDISDVANPTLAFQIDVDGAPNSVDVKNGTVAVAAAADPKTDPGTVYFYDTAGTLISAVEAGALPDMITFTPDGQAVVVANEGEPNDDYTTDPEGSVTLVDLSGGVAGVTQADVTQVGFSDFNVGGPRADDLPDGVRIFGPGASVAQDLEPEFIAIWNGKAYVTLQENNGVAIIDLATAYIDAIVALGTKDYNVAANAIDVSNEDGAINIQPWPVQGYYMPDAIAAWEIGGQGYLFTANEGDARDYDGYSEEARVKDLTLDPVAFPNAATLQLDENLGRLNITTTAGDTDGDGDFDALYNYGGRSFTIWSATDGTLLYDSANEIETRTAAIVPEWFNSNGTTASFDSRSDDKGAEPEAVTVGAVEGCDFVFVGLERTGGTLVYSLAEPAAPSYAGYIDNRTPGGPGDDGDLGPEGSLLIDAADSPTGNALYVTANEISNTTSLYELFVSDPTAVTIAAFDADTPLGALPLLAATLLIGVLGLALLRRR